MQRLQHLSTGISGLDSVIDFLRLGDNVVWQTDSVDDYFHFAGPFVRNALNEGRRVVYIRFAHHREFVENHPLFVRYDLDATGGFESFSSQVYNIIAQEGVGVYYVFDCLSDLLSAWATDLMIQNFFLITCPHLFELDTIAYFGILRDNHSFKTIAKIRETTQLLIDVYRWQDKYTIHPLKVWNRYSPTMFFPHAMENEVLVPVTNSVDIAGLFNRLPKTMIGAEKRKLDFWDRLFLEAAELYRRIRGGDESARKEEKATVERIAKLVIGRDERILKLVENYLTVGDILEIGSRLIGSGYVGGKTAGMLIARAILRRDEVFDWDSYLEPHDSYYIGSDVFYSYIVLNGWWKLRMKQKEPQYYFSLASELKEKLLTGQFPESIKEQFQQMLEYFGQSPIIVRSSSLLEDAYGNAFAGKYESVFCVNQGTPAERYAQFENAVRIVYASAMDEVALAYRKKRGLDRNDEQMAILVQRVSGAYHQCAFTPGKSGESSDEISHRCYFFPDLAGVGVSYNTYVWKKDMNPHSGMLRLVYGLGTRAVDRTEGDYPRIVPLDSPLATIHHGIADIRKYSQHEVDVLNIGKNEFETVPLRDTFASEKPQIMNLIGVRDFETENRMRELRMKPEEAWILNFENLLKDVEFPDLMRRMLKTLENTYRYPVDIEFTVNFNENNEPRTNLLQCRPLQTRGLGKKVSMPRHVDPTVLLFSSEGNFMGGNVAQRITRVLYIAPEAYSLLNNQQKYEVARTVGTINRLTGENPDITLLLMGPGRWGTTTPTMGVPVNFSEIDNTTVLVEISFSSAGLIPELSFGSHFFQDLVESEIFYVALFPERENSLLRHDFLDARVNRLEELVPQKSYLKDVIKIVDFTNESLILMSDIASQRILCFLEKSHSA